MPQATPQLVRAAIEQIRNPQIQLFHKAAYLLGAARIGELCGHLNPHDKTGSGKNRTRIYGPKGTDASTTTYKMQNIKFDQFIMAIIRAFQLSRNKDLTENETKQIAEDAYPTVEIALFRVGTEKKRLQPNEPTPTRLIALPTDQKIEPWTKDILNSFKTAGENYVFPYTRQQIWRYITYEDPVFKDLTYKIRRYKFYYSTDEVETIGNRAGKMKLQVQTRYGRTRNLKTQGIRHIRNDELLRRYHFDGLDFAAYTGWEIKSATKQGSPVPDMLSTYTEIHEDWQRYVEKLFLPFSD